MDIEKYKEDFQKLHSSDLYIVEKNMKVIRWCCEFCSLSSYNHTTHNKQHHLLTTYKEVRK